MAKEKKKGRAPSLAPWQVERMIEKAKSDAVKESVSLSLVLMFTVLLDKYAAEDYIEDIWKDWNKLASEVKEGRVKLHELRDVLRKEYKIGI